MTQESSWQQAGQIIELTQGYVLDWRGSSYACDSLDAVVAVLAKVGQSHRKPWPVPTHAADGSAPGIDAASPTDLPAALVAGDGQSLLHAAPTPEQAIANAQTLARALVAEEITPQDWDRLLRVYCPGLDDGTLDAALKEAEDESSRAGATFWIS